MLFQLTNKIPWDTILCYPITKNAKIQYCEIRDGVDDESLDESLGCFEDKGNCKSSWIVHEEKVFCHDRGPNISTATTIAIRELELGNK